MRVPRVSLADALVVGLFAAAVGVAAFALAERPSPPDRIEIQIRFSQFVPSSVVVPAGRPVTIVLINNDPIDHEWLVGDAAFHDRHRTGTEPVHDTRPTEVSIPALSRVETTITFDRPISWQFICHLPGHEAYGMVGLLTSR